MRIGGGKPIRVDIRLIAAGSKDLKSAAESGKFRRDLYYRLNVVPLTIPPLRQRREDIPILVNHFWDIFRSEMNSNLKRISPEAMECLSNYDWPGNVRELKNIIERIVVLHGSDEEIFSEHLPTDISDSGQHDELELFDILGTASLEEGVSRIEKMLIKKALKESEWNQSRAAEKLQTTRRILNYKMGKYCIGGRLAGRRNN
jgi:transcriptional regulator with PAS, ATPase and Fis domain